MFVDGLSGLFLPRQQKTNQAKVTDITLSNPSLDKVTQEIQSAAKTLRDTQGTAKVLLVVDQLDLLLAAGGEQIDAMDVGEMLMSLREVCALISRRLRGEVEFLS